MGLLIMEICRFLGHTRMGCHSDLFYVVSTSSVFQYPRLFVVVQPWVARRRGLRMGMPLRLGGLRRHQALYLDLVERYC